MSWAWLRFFQAVWNRHANKIHIIAELTEVNTNRRLWGDDFEYDSKDILSIQTMVVGEIVNALKAKVTPQEKNGIAKQYTENVDAYKYYLKGRNFWNLRGLENFDSAEANFKEAIKLDPDYALAYAGLADCYTYNQRGMSQLEAIPIAREFADKALALDSNLSEGYTSLGFIQYNFDYEWDKSKKHSKGPSNSNRTTQRLIYTMESFCNSPVVPMRD